MTTETWLRLYKLAPADLIWAYESAVRKGQNADNYREVILAKLRFYDREENIVSIGFKNVLYGATPKEVHPIERDLKAQTGIDLGLAASLYAALVLGKVFQRRTGLMGGQQLDIFEDQYPAVPKRVSALLNSIVKAGKPTFFSDSDPGSPDQGLDYLYRIGWMPCPSTNVLSEKRSAPLFSDSTTRPSTNSSGQEPLL